MPRPAGTQTASVMTLHPRPRLLARAAGAWKQTRPAAAQQSSDARGTHEHQCEKRSLKGWARPHPGGAGDDRDGSRLRDHRQSAAFKTAKLIS